MNTDLTETIKEIKALKEDIYLAQKEFDRLLGEAIKSAIKVRRASMRMQVIQDKEYPQACFEINNDDANADIWFHGIVKAISKVQSVPRRSV